MQSSKTFDEYCAGEIIYISGYPLDITMDNMFPREVTFEEYYDGNEFIDAFRFDIPEIDFAIGEISESDLARMRETRVNNIVRRKIAMARVFNISINIEHEFHREVNRMLEFNKQIARVIREYTDRYHNERS